MGTVEIRKELHDFIDREDAATLKGFYNMLVSYIAKTEGEKKIAESERDIKAGRVLSHQEVKEIVLGWSKE